MLEFNTVYVYSRTSEHKKHFQSGKEVVTTSSARPDCKGRERVEMFMKCKLR